MYSNFESVDSIYNYLVESNLQPTVSVVETAAIKAKVQAKVKASKQVASTSIVGQSNGDIQILPKGRVRYGPITVNPRKQPSKTLFTGRRSKNEVLDDEEEEKRRDRRERNRVAATKCREKRENVLHDLENEHTQELNQNKRLIKLVQQLEQRKSELESIMETHLSQCLLIDDQNNNQNSNVNLPLAPPMIFGDPSFLSSIPDTLPLPLPNPQILFTTNEQEDEEISHLLDPILTLTNSAYNEEDNSNNDLIVTTLPMTTSSIDRLINTLHTPNISMDSCNNSLVLTNSAINSTCAKQHSHSSEEDSLPKCANSYVY